MNTPPYNLIASFLAFTESDSMQAAAKGLKISQPALTSHLKSFEQYFPQPVFIFEGRRKVLTAFGKELQKLFKSRFDYLGEDLNLLVQRVQDPKHTRLKIAGLNEILVHLSKRLNFPGTLEFIPITTESAISGLQSRKYDIAISYDINSANDLHAQKFFNYDYSIAMPSNWKISSTKISKELLEKLTEFPFVSHKPESENLNTLLKKYQIKQPVYYKKIYPDWARLAEMIQAGEGWSIMPTHFTRNLNKTIEVAIPTSLIANVQFYLFYSKETLAHPHFKNTLSQLHKAIQVS